MRKRRGLFVFGAFASLAFLGVPGPGVGAAQELSVREVVGKAAPSVVYIDLFDKAGDRIGGGSGFFIAPHRVLTNAHVVDDLYSMQVVLRAPKERVDRQPKIIKYDEDVDLALLEVRRIDAPFLPIDAGVPVGAGQEVVVYGNDYEGAHLASEGIVRACLADEIVLSAPSHPGHRGSPVLDREGRVIGIVARSYAKQGISNMGFAVPLPAIREFMKKPDAPRSFPWAGDSVSGAKIRKAAWGFVSGLISRVFETGNSLFSLYLRAASIVLLVFLGWKAARLAKRAAKKRRVLRGAPAPAARPFVAYAAYAVWLLFFVIASFAGLAFLAMAADSDPFSKAVEPAVVFLVSAILSYIGWLYYRYYRPRKNPKAGTPAPMPAIGNQAAAPITQGRGLSRRA